MLDIKFYLRRVILKIQRVIFGKNRKRQAEIVKSLLAVKGFKRPLVHLEYMSKKPVLISVTSYGKRLNTLHLVLESLAEQTVKVQKVILWLDREEITMEDIPHSISSFVSRGLEIRFCDNYQSYKKIIPSLKTYPQYNIITIDDDILYPPDMVEVLVQAHISQPEVIWGHRAHLVVRDSLNQVKRYRKWKFEITGPRVSNNVFITSGGGTLFPSMCFSHEVLNDEIFMSRCPNADDIWLNLLARFSGSICGKVEYPGEYSESFTFIDELQSEGLYQQNLHEGLNDKYLKNLSQEFGYHL